MNKKSIKRTKVAQASNEEMAITICLGNSIAQTSYTFYITILATMTCLSTWSEVIRPQMTNLDTTKEKA